MADNIKVRVKAKAYERAHPKTSLSEFENDADFATITQLKEEISALREWILTAGILGEGTALPGGDISGGDIVDYSESAIVNAISAGDIINRASLPIRYYFYGGDIKGEL